MKHKPSLTPRQWIPWFIIGLIAAIYEIYTVFWGVADDTLSHVMTRGIDDAPWVGWALVGIALVTISHWTKGWLWKRPQFTRKQEDTDTSEPDDHLHHP